MVAGGPEPKGGPMGVDGGGDDNNDVYVYRYDLDEFASPTIAIVEAVADASGVSTVDLDPIGEYLMPEALNELLTGRGNGDVEVTFTYEEYKVRVGSDGHVILRRFGE